MTDLRDLRGVRDVRIGRATRTVAGIGRFRTGRRGPHRRTWIIRPDDLLVLDVGLEG